MTDHKLEDWPSALAWMDICFLQFIFHSCFGPHAVSYSVDTRDFCQG